MPGRSANGGKSGLLSRAGRKSAKPPAPLREPKPPFPKQKQDKPGIESELRPRPRYQAEQYKPANKLEGRRALITGGDSGIGRAVAVLYAREGADVAITYMAEEAGDAEETRRAVEAEGRTCITIEGDLTDPSFCREAVERTVEELGGLDILVSNAAWQNSKETLEEIEDEEFDRTFKTNVYAYFWLAKAAVRHLPRGSAIIATSSVTSFDGPPDMADYAATKGAINTFTKSLAQLLIKKGIRVNAIAPGPVWTPLNPSDAGATKEEVSKFGEDSPMGRPAQPEELAPAYVFLASEADSSYISGQVLRVLGGETSAG